MGRSIKRSGGRGKKRLESDDADFTYAYYCFHKLRMLPSQYAALDMFEKAFVIAAIDLKVEKEKEMNKKIKQ